MTDIFWRMAMAQVVEGLRSARVLMIVGARQVGKSWLARHVDVQRVYLTLDDMSILESAKRDPMGFVAQLPQKVVIDEIQRAPELLLPIKMAVDEAPTPGRFLLTGSANVLTLPKVADSLPGRMRILRLAPLTQREIAKSEENLVDELFSGDFAYSPSVFDLEDLCRRIARGGYPEVVLQSRETAREHWFDDYVASLLHRDLRDIARIDDIVATTRLLRAVAARTATLLNISNLASFLEVPRNTITRHLALLQQLFLIDRLPSWTFDRSRRLIKQPKIILTDSGLALRLASMNHAFLLEHRPQLGQFLESFIIGEVCRHASLSSIRPEVYHFRTADGREVDVLLEAPDGKKIAIEVKAAATLRAADYRHIASLMEDRKMNLVQGYVYYTGRSVIPLGPRLHALPVSSLWSPSSMGISYPPDQQ